ncbi:MAG: ATP-binding cassette domain-containing protein [Xanthomonadaceae bacterium]|nr:ATP-binding cassette domain-containing protein [Xanthomonadaceae bacterium]
MLIRIKDLTKWYFGETPVLSGVNLNVERGEFLYLLGGSGAGKSSLLRILVTEEKQTKGTLELFGYDLGKISSSTLRTIRQSIGYIPQNVRLIPDLSVYDNVALSLSLGGPKAHTGAKARTKINEILERVGLASSHAKMGLTLSGGESQRVAVARALVRSPDLIIADEPTGAQDRDFTWNLMNHLLNENQKGTAVLIATHDREMIRRVRKKCAVLKSGSLTLEDSFCIY